MLQPAIFLRAASILALIQYGAHTLVFLSAAPNHGPEELAVVDAMKSHRFGHAGIGRSYWDFYFGYGLLAILSGLVQIALLWQLATLARFEPRRTLPMVASLILANLFHALLVWKYFSLILPIAFDVLIATVLAFAFMAARPERSATDPGVQQ